tara:strand:+ start:354 stop:1202 length:849 start_codon:yes stop_codon:yes gene_type:complete
MALPSSGTLTIADIAGEFGGSAPHALSEYYRGGSLVPNVSQNNSVPTSGAISISDFYGATNYVALSILGNTTWVTGNTSSTTSSQSVSIPAGTKSVVIMGGLGTNGYRHTRHTGASLGGVALTEVISKNNALAEYTFDSAIYAGNTSLTGTQTAAMTYTNAQANYGSGHMIIFLSKPFNSFTASSSNSVATTGNPATLSLTAFGEGLQLGTATVRGLNTITNMSTVTGLTQGDSRNSIYGFQISSGSYNVSSSLSTSASNISNDFGETFVAATFAPTKFDEV